MTYGYRKVGRGFSRARKYARRRRYYRRTLSTRNILIRRSSKAQAAQIRALNSKVNKVMKQCRPETKVCIGDPIDQEFTNSIFDGIFSQYPAPYLVAGVDDTERIGSCVNRQDIYKLSFDYMQVESGSTRTSGDGGGVRVILLRFKIAASPGVSVSLDQVLRDYESSQGWLTSNYHNIQNYPLAHNIGADFIVDCDQLVTLTKSNCRKQIIVKTPWYKSTYDDATSDSPCNHSILVLISYGLLTDSSVDKSIRISGYRKVVFKDA